jgi:glycosyltransferase involved in cell wall biosynthesis
MPSGASIRGRARGRPPVRYTTVVPESDSSSDARSQRATFLGPEGENGGLFGILVTYRRPAQLSDTLSRLKAQSLCPDRLIVVDNAPSPENEELLRRRYSREGTEYLGTSANLGPAGGIALGMQRVLEFADDRDWILLLDDDDPPGEPDTVDHLYRFARKSRDADPRTAGVGLLGARFDFGRGRLHRMEDHELEGSVAVDYIGGNAFPTYLTGAVREVGTFASALFWGFDDLEFGLRLRRAGYSMYADGPRWLAGREKGGRLGLHVQPSLRVAGPNWRRYYTLRNVIYILRTHGHRSAALRVSLLQGLGKPLANLVVDPRASVQSLAMNWKSCRDGWLGRMGLTVEPVMDKGSGEAAGLPGAHA